MGVTNEKQEVSFEEWVRENPIFEHQIVKENSRWGRVVCVWHEEKEDGKVLQHQFAACVNLKNGDVYLDCSKKKLFAKNLTLTFARPLHALFKTLYHASMIGMVVAVHKGIKKKQTGGTIFVNCVKELADIVRTPLYAVVLTVISATAVVLSVVHPKSLYDMRNLYGRVEQSLNWGKKQSSWTLAICFQSVFNIRGPSMGVYYKNKKTEKLEVREEKCQAEIAELKKEIEGLTVKFEAKIQDKANKHNGKTKIKNQITKNLKKLHELEKQYYSMRLDNIKEYTIDYLDDHGKTIYDTKAEDTLMNLLLGLHQERLKAVDPKNENQKTKLKGSIAELEETFKTLLPKLQAGAILNYRLTHYAANMINDRREVGWNPFYQLGKLSPDHEYTSPVMKNNNAFDKVRARN